MAENLPLPKKRDLFFTKQVDQSSIGELTQKVIEINLLIGLNSLNVW
jgi:hypothetical protein